MSWQEKKCKFCNKALKNMFLQLGNLPLANSYLQRSQLDCKEATYPLQVYVCSNCLLVQLGHCVPPEKIFTEYAYFSSYAKTLLEHASTYVDNMLVRYRVAPNWQIVEVGSNDGYLLQYFKAKNFQVCGIEPAKNVAKAAVAKGIMTKTTFFGLQTAMDLQNSGLGADLLIANNVLAHVPSINDFVAGINHILKPSGIATLEFPHLLAILENNQFDTIYHEHYFYFSLIAVMQIFAAHNLEVFAVDKLAIHGGSLRVHVKKSTNYQHKICNSVREILNLEQQLGLDDLATYYNLQQKTDNIKRQLLTFVTNAKKAGKTIACYGAPAKGNTLLNYCDITTDLINFAVDKNPHKQNCFLPGSHIPIFAVNKTFQEKPDYLLILPWNLKEEIIESMAEIRNWGGKFVIPIPELEVYP